jgi:hypothetical protein
MIRQLALVCLLCQLGAASCPASGYGEYFVAPSGREDNAGSESSPWPSVEFALNRVGGGNTITLLPGDYTEPIIIERSGPNGHPTTIRSLRKWEAILQKTTSHGIYTSDGVTNVVIDGLQIAHAGIDGAKVGSYVTVRNCWIHHATHQGISAHRTCGTIVEFCLIEHNGTDPEFDHGVYMSGTNDIVRCNVIRWNKTYGCQIYYDPPASSAECQFYNNLVYGNKNALTVWSPAGQTNYVFSNTLISTNYVLIADFGTLGATNNILLGAKWHRAVSLEDGARLRADCNLILPSVRTTGPHDVVAFDPGLISVVDGLFGPARGSPARGRAAAGMVPPMDFWGRRERVLTDIGALQYRPYLSSAQHPPVVSAAGIDYWAFDSLGPKP